MSDSCDSFCSRKLDKTVHLVIYLWGDGAGRKGGMCFIKLNFIFV